MTTSGFHPAIAATGLRKSFGDKVVLDGIDLHVAEGSIFSLLGPNGAGKTTAVQILDGLRTHHAVGADHVGIQVIGEPGETPTAGFRQLAEQLSAEAAW
jgi:ABC-2 type transport system ATP-binding protein